MATTAKYLGDNLIRQLGGRTTTETMKAALRTLQVATDGTQEASKFITTDANTNQGVVKCTAFHMGTSGSETQVNATGAEINQACDLSAKGLALTATKSVAATDNGKIFFLNAAGGFTSTLPALSSTSAGWRCRFIVKTAPTSNYVITELAASDTNKIVTNFIIEGEVDNGDHGPANTGHTTVTFAANVADAGDWVEFTSDGAVWYCKGQTNNDGGITLA